MDSLETTLITLIYIKNSFITDYADYADNPFAISSVPLVLFFLVSLVFFALLFYLLFSLPLTLIIDIFYCLNYTSLLLYLITTHLVSHLFLSSIIFSISTLCIFYCLTVCYFYVTYAFQNESALYSCLTVKEFYARSR